MNYKKWIFPEIDKQAVSEVAEDCGLDPLVVLIAFARGLTEPYEIEQFIEKANTLANIIYDYGFKFTYHNHSHEFVKIGPNGETMMDILVKGLDPVKTSFVLDTCWVQNAGCDVRYWIEKLAGRIDILHLKDVGFGGGGLNGMFITEVGNGNLYWEGILETAQKTGIQYYVVEQDTCPGDPFDSVRKSAEYLKKNFM